MSSSGDFCLSEKISAHSLTCDTGSTLFEKKNAPTETKAMATANGRMIRKRLIPAAFMAVSSNFSPRLPKLINDANNMANGNANGTTDATA